MKKRTSYVSYGTALFLLACFMTCTTRPATYYIDATGGNDGNNGTSERQAWRSVSRVKNLTLRAGDKVLIKRGNTYPGELHICARGTPEAPVMVSAYGTGGKPCITGTDTSACAVWIYNSEYIRISDLEITNTGQKRKGGRTGIKVEAHNYGTSRSISLQNLYVHDVNGSLVKKEGGGSGMLFVNGGEQVVSVFDGLSIENCTIRRCERNALIWEGYSSRSNWHPNKNVVVRYNLIEEVPGDGIVPIGCDSALIEYNRMRNCPPTLPETEAAAGIWPWSCDHTLIQFNEVSDHKAPWDAQGFDSDWNCNNTVIQYNYSHDNEGGFLLVCNDGSSGLPFSAGNRGTVVRYNISINDGIRTRPTRSGIFSPGIHIAGPVKQTRIHHNIMQVNKKPSSQVDRSVMTVTSWNGFADSLFVSDNLFYVAEPSRLLYGNATNYRADGNYYLGELAGNEDDVNLHTSHSRYQALLEKDSAAYHSLSILMDSIQLGKITLVTVNKAAIESFLNANP